MDDDEVIVKLDRMGQVTVTAALIFYALSVAQPEDCIRALDAVSPGPAKPWVEIVAEARAARGAVLRSH